MASPKAVALKYNQSAQQAPSVVAKGSGKTAQKIIEKAHEFDIPLFKNPELANSLIHLELDQEIPPQLYHAVVEVFQWLMESEKKQI